MGNKVLQLSEVKYINPFAFLLLLQKRLNKSLSPVDKKMNCNEFFYKRFRNEFIYFI